MVMMPADLLSILGLALAGLLTVFTLSYVFGDNPLFRTAIYLFIGVSAGFVAAIAIDEIIWPQLILPIQAWWLDTPILDTTEILVRVILTLLLLTKLTPRLARLGNPVMAMIVGVGASLALAGAIQGTLIPQIGASNSVFDTAQIQLALQGGYLIEAAGTVVEGLITLLATIGTLAYFHFGAQARGNLAPERSVFVESLAWLGNIFIPLSLAVLFSGVLLTALSALIERLDFLTDLITNLVIGN